MPENKLSGADFDFRMCKYCGCRIVKAFDRWGKPSPVGAYCSPECSNAVHGFDNRIESERRNKTVSFNPAIHDTVCTQTKSPFETMMEAEEETPRNDKTEKAVAALEAARKIDKRLPDILMGIANGETQEQAAKRWGMTQARVAQLINKLRATI